MNKEEYTIIPESGMSATADIGEAVKEILAPLMNAMITNMQYSAEALERIAAQQKVQSDRLEALEKQIRLNTLVTPVQVRYINDEIKRQARKLLEKYGMQDNTGAVKKLCAMIRKSVMTRYGVGALHDIPKHEYTVVLNQIGMWNDMLAVRDVKKAFEKENE